MSPQRVSKSGKAKPTRFSSSEDRVLSEDEEVVRAQRSKELGLTQVDSTYAIGQSGGVVVVMQELHNESAQDTGDFVAVQSKFDKRKQAQVDREELDRKRRADEKKAVIAAKKAEEAQAAQEAAEAAQEAARAAKEIADAKEAAERQAAEEKKEKARRERKAAADKKAAESKLAEKKAVESKLAAKEESVRREKEKVLVQAAPVTAPRAPPPPPSAAILRDSAVVGIGSVIGRSNVPKVAHAETQTDPVRILPIETSSDHPPVSAPSYAVGSAPASVAGPTRPSAAAAAWWLQQVAAPAPANDQFMYQPAQPSNYYYQNDLYWQQNAYQTAPGRYPPRRQ